MSSDNFTCKLPIANSERLCILNSQWSDESVKLLLLHNGEAWSGEFQFNEDDDSSELSDQFSPTEEQYYIEETKNALTTQGGGKNFVYTIKNGKFTWKKLVTANIAIKCGYVALSKVPAFEIFEKIIDNNIRSNLTTNEKLFNTDKERQNVEKENTDLKLKLNDLIEPKDEMEKTLYREILVVLKEIRKKIKKIKKINCNNEEEEENASYCQERNSDHFSSDIELDTDEEVKPSPSRVDFVGSKSNVEENIYVFPKKSRTPRKNENTASSSSVDKRTRNTRNASKSKTQNVTIESDSGSKSMLKGTKRKVTKDSCVMSKRTNKKEKNNSEEDVFMFPKRSKMLEHKPPISRKFTFEDSDEDETYGDEPK